MSDDPASIHPHFGQYAKGGLEFSTDLSASKQDSVGSGLHLASTPDRSLYGYRKSISAVKTFQLWLALEHDEARPVEQIEPGTLDSHLAQFFSVAKKRNGENYTAKSFDSLREGIKLHLKAASYPYCIVTSPRFLLSRTAFKARRRDLINSQVTCNPPDQ